MAEKIALISVWNKDGVIDFAKALLTHGFDKIISSGGTARALAEAGVPVTDVAKISGLEAVLDHRVVTLVPQIHGGLLAMEKHLDELEKLGWPKIDLVCVDLYPLESEIADPESTRDSVIEKTDIGGPTMLRSGAKGRRIVVPDHASRGRVISWLKEGRPNEEAFITELVARTEGIVAKYCLASARYHSNGDVDGMIGTKVRDLRYGENPYMKARLYKTNENPLGVPEFEQIAGADPSMVNMTDIDRLARTMIQIAATFELSFGQVPCIALAAKHGNACGASVAMHPATALKKMLDGDPLAVFGGAIMTNFAIDQDGASFLRTYGMSGSAKRLLDAVISPSFSDDASEVLERKHGKCRMFQNPVLARVSREYLPRIQYRRVGGGFIRQDGYPFVLDIEDSRMEKGGTTLTTSQKRDMALAFAIGSTSVSNTITIVKNEQLFGNGVGQQARVRAARVALMIAQEGKHDVNDAVAYSDSFFPEPDGPLVLADAGIKTIFASSGSVKDAIVRAALAEKNVAFWQLPDTVCRGFFHH